MVNSEWNTLARWADLTGAQEGPGRGGQAVVNDFLTLNELRLVGDLAVREYLKRHRPGRPLLHTGNVVQFAREAP